MQITLTKQQAKAASALFQARPAVIPGTRAIIDAEKQRVWFAQVNNALAEHGITSPRDINAFCDLAGVPD